MIFHLKRNVSNAVHENLNLPNSNFIVEGLVDEPRSKMLTETSFCHDFITTFLMKDFNISSFAGELVPIFFIEKIQIL